MEYGTLNNGNMKTASKQQKHRIKWNTQRRAQRAWVAALALTVCVCVCAKQTVLIYTWAIWQAHCAPHTHTIKWYYSKCSTLSRWLNVLTLCSSPRTNTLLMVKMMGKKWKQRKKKLHFYRKRPDTFKETWNKKWISGSNRAKT